METIYVKINLPDFYRLVSTGTNHSSDGSIDLVTSWDKGDTVGSERDSSGAMVTGWKKIDGKWYYFNPVSDGARGTMAADSEIDGHRIGSDGTML